MPFSQEKHEKHDEIEEYPAQGPSTGTLGLLAVAAIGLTSQVLNAFFPIREPMAIYPAIAWVSTTPTAHTLQLTSVAGHHRRDYHS